MHRHIPLNEASKLLVINRIGQILQHLPYDCRSNTRTGACYSAQDDDGVTAYRHCYCKKLTCRTCAGHRYRELYDALSAHPFTHFLVLTLPGDVQLSDIEPKLKKALARFLQEANRLPKTKRLSYFWSLGIGDRGRLHVNLLIDTDFSSATRYGKPVKQWDKKTWHRLTGAHRVTLQKITPGTLSNVAGYILCDMLQTVLKCPSIKRREGCSRAIKLKRPRPAKREGGQKWARELRTTAQCAKDLGLNHHMTENVGFDVKLSDLPAASAAQSTTLSEPSLESGAAAGGTGLPADGRAGVGTHGEVLP